MRISDWSSDVCSSDLAGRAAAGDARAATVIGGHAFAQFEHDALGGLLADAGDADERGHVAGLHQARELVDAGARQHRQRDLRADAADPLRSEEHTSELQSLMRIPYAVFCLKNNNTKPNTSH